MAGFVTILSKGRAIGLKKLRFNLNRDGLEKREILGRDQQVVSLFFILQSVWQVIYVYTQ